MKNMGLYCLLLLLLIPAGAVAQNIDRMLVEKDNGTMYFAYKGFEQFLRSGKTWEEFKTLVHRQFPAMAAMHERYIEYDLVDAETFPQEVAGYTYEDFADILEQVDQTALIDLYDRVITQMDAVLPPREKADVCFFLPYGRDCFVQGVNGRNTVFISAKYPVDEMYLIMVHEYGHILHHQRRPEESSVLRRWIISEGIASYFPQMISEDHDIYDCLWMMTKEAVDWCIAHEDEVLALVFSDLDNGDMDTTLTYIAGGEGFATPPEGFPEKTGYYVGYRIVEECLNKSISFTELCTMDAASLFYTSGLYR